MASIKLKSYQTAKITKLYQIGPTRFRSECFGSSYFSGCMDALLIEVEARSVQRHFVQ
jgi:hypothetical protein